MPTVPRRLVDFHAFRDGHDFGASVLPWPKTTDVLLRPYAEGESWIYPMERWVPNLLERLTYFVIQYQEMAQEAVKAWIRNNKAHAENYIFVIAYLYRHAIELRLKSIIVETAAFHLSDDASKRKMIEGHSILGLWQRAVPELPDELKHDLPMITRLMAELHHLDTNSDGFRYPFRFGRDDRPTPVVEGLADASGDNLVWVLEAMLNWLNGVPDAFEREREFEAETRHGAG